MTVGGTDSLRRLTYAYLVQHPGATMGDFRHSGQFEGLDYVLGLAMLGAAGLMRVDKTPHDRPGWRYYPTGEGRCPTTE